MVYSNNNLSQTVFHLFLDPIGKDIGMWIENTSRSRRRECSCWDAIVEKPRERESSFVAGPCPTNQWIKSVVCM